MNGEMPPATPGLATAEVLRERVYNNERLTISLQGEVHEIRATMATQEDMRSLQSAISALASKMDAVGRPQWQALSLIVTVLVIIGGILYWPIRESTSELKDNMKVLQTQLVPRVEHEKEWRRAEMALTSTQARIEKNQDNLVPRDVFTQSTVSLQRQIEDIRKDIGGVVTTRDVLQNVQKQIEQLQSEQRTLAIRNGRAP